ncbi:MAG: NYN domain-containing protein [Melioribacteraceae bacterium]|nr:NYN domain-containing protein [Melioribacteraceae bacterium]MCF8394662.1 NYN domain-containing protein [Melioribacteraceae bacterium]MCF8418004.1 NYN domain-containing protein [Melioribacteraceae bacterium]
MKKIIIDGNNLIGKIPELFMLQKSDGQSSREKLVFLLDRYFARKKVKVSLHFDGYVNLPIRSSKMKIYYSDSRQADDFIRREIDQSNNPKLLLIVTSDLNLLEYAKVNSCERMKSEELLLKINQAEDDDEKKKIESINNEEIKKLFGVD